MTSPLFAPERAQQIRYPHPSEIWRFKLCARVVIYSIALGAVDVDSEEACARLFWHGFEQHRDQLTEWVAGLELECERRGKSSVIAIAGGMLSAATKNKHHTMEVD
jgi:hypothetical protein